jgi:hypothetical protein
VKIFSYFRMGWGMKELLATALEVHVAGWAEVRPCLMKGGHDGHCQLTRNMV